MIYKICLYGIEVNVEQCLFEIVASANDAIKGPRLPERAAGFPRCVDPLGGRYFYLAQDSAEGVGLRWCEEQMQVVRHHEIAEKGESAVVAGGGHGEQNDLVLVRR